ncbi:chorismate synthase [Candidatus Carsonella ruddii CS isolate Thao2000]|uniref:Chorismate synthase n=1 Tax=Candidatus Carsonella ruddii CS isolate Thao2000 TaxID=1202537 RepID=J7GYS5_CARRU|nr:chorismate synthase [Candidatus Carsonella ruddii]AFP83753.1 chorismate synthase [Candidatus Carsonella ruddii CS isolate Thao2000]
MNNYGDNIKITTFGESHGVFIGAVLDGFFSNKFIYEKNIQKELNLRKPFTSLFSTQRKELDKVKIITGVFNNKTTGAPILLIIKNNDKRSFDYKNISTNFRPGHSDYTYFKKYKFRDYRGGGRSSARETAARVASSSIFKKYIYNKGINIRSYIKKIGAIKIKFNSWKFIKNRFYINIIFLNDIKEYINYCKNICNSLSAEIITIINGIFPGIGEPIYDKLDSNIANYLISINAVKSIEIGLNLKKKNSFIIKDEIISNGFLSNNNGGVLGGISNGQPLIIKTLFKPTSSTSKKIKTINEKNLILFSKTYGRHDPCVGLRAIPVIESMLSTIIINFILKNNKYE